MTCAALCVVWLNVALTIGRMASSSSLLLPLGSSRSSSESVTDKPDSCRPVSGCSNSNSSQVAGFGVVFQFSGRHPARCCWLSETVFCRRLCQAEQQELETVTTEQGRRKSDAWDT